MGDEWMEPKNEGMVLSVSYVEENVLIRGSCECFERKSKEKKNKKSLMFSSLLQQHIQHNILQTTLQTTSYNITLIFGLVVIVDLIQHCRPNRKSTYSFGNNTMISRGQSCNVVYIPLKTDLTHD